MNPHILFKLATSSDRDFIKDWWTKPHVMEFWDNSPEIWQNVENYFLGKKELFDYWIAYFDNEPFALLMTSELDKELNATDPYAPWLEPNGVTITIDFMIGNENFLGKHLSYVTLNQFAYFMKNRGASAVIIDPAANNHRAVHVYQKAGFKIVDSFIKEKGYFTGIKHYLMKRQLYFKFSPVQFSDIPLLYRWFNEIHVQAFYSFRTWTIDEVYQKMEPYISGKQTVFGFIILDNDIPIGYIQYYRTLDFPCKNSQLSQEIIENAAGLDLFIGNRELINKGYGQKIIQQFLDEIIWQRFKYCIVDPDIKNKAAIRVYKKLCFKDYRIIKSENTLKQAVNLNIMILEKK